MNVHRTDLARLGRELGNIYESSPRGEKVTALHLFGIRHAEEMTGLTSRELEEIARAAGLTPSFGTELRKMVNLSRYVVPRDLALPLALPRTPKRASVFAELARSFPADFKFNRDEANAR